MNLLKELYAFESYFLTKKGLELGDKRWLEKHPVNFVEPSPVIFKDLITLFRRVLRTMLKPHPDTKVSIRNNKREFVVGVSHPMLDLLPGIADIPYRVFESGTITRPHAPHLRMRYRNGRSFYFPGVGTSRCPGSPDVRFRVGTTIIQLSSGSYPPNRHYRYSAAEARASAKIFVGNSSLMSFADEIESYITYLENLYTAIYDLLNTDIEDIVHINSIQTPMAVILQPRADVDLDAYLDACAAE